MKVYGFTKDNHGVMGIENTLEAEQKFVGGLIECTALTEDIELVCNEEGLGDWFRAKGSNTGTKNSYSRGLLYMQT